MKIFLNDHPIDFQLKAEKTLGEVLTALESWVQKEKHFIGEIRVDDQVIDGEDKLQRERPLEEIDTLRCELLSGVAYAVSVWAELSLHLEPFSRITAQSVTDQIEDISARLAWVKKVITKLGQFFKAEEENRFLIRMIKELEVTVFQIKSDPSKVEKVPTLLQKIDEELSQGLFKLNLKIVKSGLKEDIPSICNSLENYSLFLEIMEEKLPLIAAAFQKSQFKPALESLAVVAEGLGIFLILDKQIHKQIHKHQENLGGEDRKESIESIKNLLQEVEEAVQNQDYIQAADIIEYEIKEMVPTIQKFLEKMGEEMQKLNQTHPSGV